MRRWHSLAYKPWFDSLPKDQRDYAMRAVMKYIRWTGDGNISCTLCGVPQASIVELVMSSTGFFWNHLVTEHEDCMTLEALNVSQ